MIDIAYFDKNKNKTLICSVAGAVNLLLFFIKFYVALSSNSISIYVDSLNSLADTFICLMAVVGFKISAKEKNENYPFGYGKAEELINFILSLVILFTGGAFAYSSLERLMYPVPVWFTLKNAVIVAASAAVKLFMAIAYKKFNQKVHSSVIKNLSIDSVLDFFVSACVVASFTLTTVFGYAVDSLTGMAASLIIIVSGIKALVSVCGKIIGKNDKETVKQAYDLLISDCRVTEVTQVKAHIYGENAVINAEIRADVNTADEVSLLCDSLKANINKNLNAELFVTFGGKGNE